MKFSDQDAAPALTEDEQAELWEVIADVRDASPRTPDDADTWDIVAAIDKWLASRQRPNTCGWPSVFQPGAKCRLHAGHELHSFFQQED